MLSFNLDLLLPEVINNYNLSVPSEIINILKPINLKFFNKISMHINSKTNRLLNKLVSLLCCRFEH